MSRAEELIVAALTGDAAVASLAGGRIYPLVAPEAAPLPLITFQRISGNHLNTLEGYEGTAKPRIQVDCWAATYPDVKTLATAARDAICASAELAAVILTDIDLYDDQTREFRVLMDFSCWSKE